MVSSGVGQAQKALPSITYRTQAVALRQALQDLSKQTGKKLVADPTLEAEPVTILVRGVDLPTLQSKLADVMSAEWVPVRDGQMLVRKAAVLKRLDEDRRVRLAATIQEVLYELASRRRSEPQVTADSAKQVAVQLASLIKSGQHTSEGAAAMATLEGRSAESRLLTDMLLSIGAESLASLPTGKHVFSLNPTNAELPLEGISSGRITQYVAERNLLADAITKTVGDPIRQTGGRYATTAVPINNPSITPLLTIRFDAVSREMRAYLAVFNSEGEQVGDALQRLDNAVGYPQFVKEREKVAGYADRIKVSPALAAISRRVAESNSGGKETPLPPEAVQKLLDPVSSDPLQISFSEPLMAIADKDGSNLIATAGDASFFPCIFYGLKTNSAGTINPALYKLVLRTRASELVEEKDGWLIVKPGDPLQASETRVGRLAFRAFVQAVHEKGYGSLEDWAALTAAHETRPAEDIIFLTDRILRGSRISWDEGNDWNAYRLYGSLSEAQVLAISKGGSLDYGGMSAEQKQCLWTLLYGDSATLLGPQATGDPKKDQEALYDYQGKIQAEATRSVPHGIPDAAKLRMEDNTVETFYATGEKGDTVRDAPLSLDTIAQIIAARERPDLFPAGQESQLSWVAYGGRRSLVFTLTMPNGLALRAPLTEEQKPKGDPIAISALKDVLPEEVWQRLEKRIAFHRDDIKKREKEIRKDLRVKEQSPPL
ncbi:MAG: hypothetical protein QOJ65_1964 [Fimbriimonadaceae bacterium]|nr:hypothetical protein [Fimbriimonadaceae bacterium]